MNWKQLDAVRRNVGPLENDLVDAYAANKISRRSFVQRGTILGLSVGTMGAVIAACGSDEAATPAADDTSDAAAETDSGGAETEEAAASSGPVKGGVLTVAIQTGDANSGLDPLNMLDLGTYCVTSQSFEYLVGLDPTTGGVGATGLASSWEANEAADVWTFKLREGVMWHDGTPLTAADVAATLDRMVVGGKGLAGVLAEGAVEMPDDNTVVCNLEGANSNFPVLVSLYNPQSLITPADYADGTVLDERPAGTGPFILDSFDATTFTVTYKANENYWGGAPLLDGVTLQGFDSGGTKVAAFAAGEVDAIQDFSVTDGAQFLEDPEVTVLRPPSANHRKIWFNTQLPEGGPFTDARVRRAACMAIDRERIIDTVYQGAATLGNDHVIHPSFPAFDPSLEQRERDVEGAKALLAEAGWGDGFEAPFQVGDIGEVPQIAAIIEQNLAEIGITAPVGVTPNSDFYGEHWCAGATWGAQPDTGGPGRPCGASSQIGIVDYGHRPTPDVYFGRALRTDGDWNGANYNSPEFDDLFTEFQRSVDVEARRTVTGKIQRLLHEECPNGVHSFFDYLSGHSTGVHDVHASALGHLELNEAWKDEA